MSGKVINCSSKEKNQYLRNTEDKRSLVEAEEWQDFEYQVSDLLCHTRVREMDNYIHHNDVTTLEHCLSVAYMSFQLSKKFNLDSRSVARGALLHDLYLYDWHVVKPAEGLHGFTHPGIALRNASALFKLNHLESDIISKHMWPLTIKPPRHRESLLVCLVDKYCAFLEVILGRRKKRLELLKSYMKAYNSDGFCSSGQ